MTTGFLCPLKHSMTFSNGQEILASPRAWVLPRTHEPGTPWVFIFWRSSTRLRKSNLGGAFQICEGEGRPFEKCFLLGWHLRLGGVSLRAGAINPPPPPQPVGEKSVQGQKLLAPIPPHCTAGFAHGSEAVFFSCSSGACAEGAISTPSSFPP